jgi:hypothetical protein
MSCGKFRLAPSFSLHLPPFVSKGEPQLPPKSPDLHGGKRKPMRKKPMQIKDIEMSILSKILGGDIRKWRIGLTNDLRVRYEHWKQTENLSVRDWDAWEADSLSDAQALEAKFIREGMKGGTGGNLSASWPVFVYVFD